MMKEKYILIIVLLLLGKNSFSCDCAPYLSVKEEIKSSSIVVSGEVVKVEYGKSLNQDKSYLDSLSEKYQSVFFGPKTVNEYTVVLKYSFKGEVEKKDTVIIRTSSGESACGIYLELHSNYIFYAGKIEYGSAFYDNCSQSVFVTSACSRTRLYEKKEIREIKKYSQVIDKSKIIAANYMFTNIPLLIDRTFNDALKVKLLMNDEHLNKCEINSVEGKYYGISKFQNNGCNSYILFEKRNNEYTFYYVSDELGFSRNYFLTIAKFSNQNSNVDPDYACFLDSSGNYSFYNPFLNGFNTISNCPPFSGELKYASDNIQDSANVDIPYYSNFLKRHTNIIDSIEISISEINNGGYMPLSIFIRDSLINMLSMLNIRKTENTFLVAIRKEVKSGDIKILFFDKKEMDDKASDKIFCIVLNSELTGVKDLKFLGEVMFESNKIVSSEINLNSSQGIIW